MRRCAALLLLLTAPLASQTTWIVDASGGPGAQFTDIQAAVDAAADGDRILVRAGSYAPFQIDGKGLAVLGEDNVLLRGTGQLHVSNTAPGQDVVLTDLDLDASPPIFSNHGATLCRGRLLMERVTLRLAGSSTRFEGCADLRFSELETQAGIAVTNSTATITDSRLLAGVLTLFPPPALQVSDSRVTISNSSVSGQSQFNRAGPSSAIAMSGASVLTLTDDGTHLIAAGGSQAGPYSGISGSGTVVRDPNVTIQGSSGGPAVDLGIQEIVRAIPCLSVRPEPARSTIELALTGATGEAYAVFFGLPAAPFELPGIGGTIGIGAPLASFLGVFGGGPVQQTYGIGPGLPPGFQLCWQAIASDSGERWHVSAPATYARTR